MNALYLIRQDGGQIAIPDFLKVVGDLSGAKNLKTENAFLASAEVDYFYGDDRTIIRLDEDQQLIAITGVGEASIDAVCEIQKRYTHPLRLFDMDYTLDIMLTGIPDFERLKMQIKG